MWDVSVLHSDNAKSFLSRDFKKFLLKRGVVSSKSSPYHPIGNLQVKRYVGVVWKSILLVLGPRIYLCPFGKLSYLTLYILFDLHYNVHIFEAFRLTLVKKNRQYGERKKMSGYL